jgi:aminopeptidase N
MVSMDGEETKLAGINLVHELVHSALTSPRPWIYEGIAHFAEAVYREQQGGRQAALDLMSAHQGAFVDAEKDVAASAAKNPGEPLLTSFDEIYYRSKAAYVWWMLRDMVGDEALKSGIGKYRASEDRNPKYMEGLIEASSGHDLGWFFDDWVYHDRGLPDFRVQSVHPWEDDKADGGKRAQMLTVTLENKGNAGAEVPFTVRCEDSQVARRLQVPAKSTATMRVEMACTPLEVVVNDGSVPESDLTNNVFKIEAQP